MKIRDFALGAIAALAMGFASPAGAAVWTVNFTVYGDWTVLINGMPFTLPAQPGVLNGSFSYDDSTWSDVYTGEIDYKNIVAVDWSPGNQVWALGDVSPLSYARAAAPGGTPTFFALLFDNIASTSSLQLNLVQPNIVSLWDGGSSAACIGEACVNWGVMEGLPGPATVPEPTTWAMMILGFGLAGSALRGRRQAARFQP